MFLFGVFFLLLITMIEIRGNQFQQKNIFLLVETIFDFLPEEAVFPHNGKVFFNECLIPFSLFSLWWKPSTLLETSFLTAETVTDMSGNHFLNTDLILSGGNSFSS